MCQALVNEVIKRKGNRGNGHRPFGSHGVEDAEKVHAPIEGVLVVRIQSSECTSKRDPNGRAKRGEGPGIQALVQLSRSGTLEGSKGPGAD